MARQRTQFGLAALVAGLLVALVAGFTTAGCGARTGLGEPCVIRLTRARPRMVIVVDHSASMLFPTRDGRSFWRAMVDSVSDTLPPFDQDVAAGLLVFPIADPRALLECRAPSSPDLEPAFGASGAIRARLNAVGGPSGSSPVHDAIRAAGNALLAAPDDAPRFLVVGTDGAASCNPDIPRGECICPGRPVQRCLEGPQSLLCLDSLRTVSLVRDFAARGVFTVVIGVGASLQPEHSVALEAMAQAGGFPRTSGGASYYNASDGATVREAFEGVIANVGACQLRASRQPADWDSVVVHPAGGPSIARDRARQNGWDVVDRARGIVGFFGAACDALVREHPSLVADTGESGLCAP